MGPPAAMPPVGMALPLRGRAYGRGEQGARARLTCVAALRRSFGFAKGAPRANPPTTEVVGGFNRLAIISYLQINARDRAPQ